VRAWTYVYVPAYLLPLVEETALYSAHSTTWLIVGEWSVLVG